MHASLSPVVLGLAAFALAVAGCREAGETPVAPTGPPPAPAITPALVIGCMAPFTPTTTRADLAAAFGEGNVRQEAVAGPEGMKVNVTAIYPGDPSRRAEVTFADDASGTGLTGVSVGRAATQWSGQNGLAIGDGIEAVERANGGVFLVSGFDWDYGGYVTDWRDGQLDSQAAGCRTMVRFERTANLEDASISGDGKAKKSDLEAMRAAEPRVVAFGVQWSTPRPQQ